MDVVGDILASLRLTGGVILEGSASGDWCVYSQMQPDDVAELFPAGGPVIAYHYIKHGKLWAQVEGQQPVAAGEGSILMFPRNDEHRLFTSDRPEPIDSHEFLVGATERGLARFTIDGPGQPVEFYCGFLGVEAGEHPLLDCLPPLLKIDDISEAQEAWLEGNLNYLTHDRQEPEVVARIAELLFAEAIRAYVDDLPAGEGGWLAGLRDPAVARALAYIHAHYAEELEIEQVAREAGVSRSILGERFVQLLGDPPMRYCARWRMRKAADLLRHGKDNTANVAYAVGFNSEAAFNRAFKREYGLPPAAWKRQALAQDVAQSCTASFEQEVRFAHAHDGTKLAWSALGEGLPLVKTANWLNHLEFDCESPLWRGWLREFTRDFRLIRYDERGNGLSDWDTPDMSLDAFVDDLACVVDEAGLEQFDLLAISQGAPVAIAYSILHPERVRRMVLLGGYAAGWRARGDNEEVSRREAMLTLTELGWGKDNPAYRQLFTSFYIPGADAEQSAWFNELQRRSASPENAVRLMRELSRIDVRHLLRRVTHPTLVLHARSDAAVPFSEGELLASHIPNARFVPLDSANHILLDGEPAFRTFVDETRRFLRASADRPAAGMAEAS